MNRRLLLISALTLTTAAGTAALSSTALAVEGPTRILERCGNTKCDTPTTCVFSPGHFCVINDTGTLCRTTECNET